MIIEPNGQPPAEKNGAEPLAVDSSAQMEPSQIEGQTEAVFEVREATTRYERLEHLFFVRALPALTMREPPEAAKGGGIGG